MDVCRRHSWRRYAFYVPWLRDRLIGPGSLLGAGCTLPGDTCTLLLDDFGVGQLHSGSQPLELLVPSLLYALSCTEARRFKRASTIAVLSMMSTW